MENSNLNSSKKLKSKSKILKGAGMLAIAAIIAKAIGVLYRIPLTNIVGSSGIGLYHMIFPLYVLLLTISSGGLPIAISKVVAVKIANGDKAGTRRVLKLSLISLTSIGLALALLLFFMRNIIANLQGNPSVALGYAAIAPAIVFVAIIASFRGYFQGHQNMLPSSISQLVEQVIKMGAGIVLAILLLPRGIEMAIFGALLGVSISEGIAALILWLQYLHFNKKSKNKNFIVNNNLKTEFATDVLIIENMANSSIETKGQPPCFSTGARSVLKEIYAIALPVTLGSLVMPLMGLIDSVMVVNLLVRGGISVDTATSLFGILTGPVGTLLNMPTVVTLAFAVALLPKISESIAKSKNPKKYINQCFKWCIILGAAASILLVALGWLALRILYSGGLTVEELSIATRLLAIGSVSVLLISILQVATSVLQGMGKAHKPAINLAIGAVFKITLSLLLLPLIGIYGAAIATVACYGITCLLNIVSYKRLRLEKLETK